MTLHEPAWTTRAVGAGKGGVPASQDNTTSLTVSHSTEQACVETVVWTSLNWISAGERLADSFKVLVPGMLVGLTQKTKEYMCEC